MKRLVFVSFALALLVPTLALAQSAFNGTWKTQPASARSSGKPLIIHLKDGIYQCNCTPPIKIKADGEEHAVTGHPDYDAMAVKVVNDHTIQITQKRADKVTLDETVTVAPDGKTATFEYTDTSGSTPTKGKGVAERLAKGDAGSNAVAGSWKFGHWDTVSDNAMTFTYKVDGNNISFSDPTGDSYTAEIGGKAVPFTSTSYPGLVVSVKKLGKDSLRETYERNGKTTSTVTLTVASDGKTMKTVYHDVQASNTMTSAADKQ